MGYEDKWVLNRLSCIYLNGGCLHRSLAACSTTTTGTSDTNHTNFTNTTTSTSTITVLLLFKGAIFTPYLNIQHCRVVVFKA